MDLPFPSSTERIRSFFAPQPRESKPTCFEKAYGWLAGGVSVSTAAWIGSLVLIMWYFYLITPISLLANLAVVPVAFCVLAVALMSLVVAPFSTSLSLVFNNANWSLSN